MATPKSIKIFLPTGNPTGIKISELSNWTGKALFIPRTLINEALKRNELNAQSLYFLIGTDENENQSVYIGEAENFKERILQHNKTKDFWHTAIAFISKDENLTKAHVKHLESLAVKDLMNAKRVKFENGNSPKGAKLSESDTYEIEEFYQNVKLIMSAFGYSFLESVLTQNNNQQEIFHCEGKGISASMKITDEGYVLLSGSQVYSKDSNSLGYSLKNLRNKFLSNSNIKKLDDGNFELIQDLLFTSPSTALAFVLGRNVNGWLYWKDKNGNSLDKVKRQSLNI